MRSGVRYECCWKSPRRTDNALGTDGTRAHGQSNTYNPNTNTNSPKGTPWIQDSPPETQSNKLCSQDPFNTHVRSCQKSYKFQSYLGHLCIGKYNVLHTKTAETRWSSGYSELMFRHILCHHHYWHRPGVIRARMLVTQRQFCMTSSNDAKTDKSAQIRESKFSLMTQ